MTHGFIVKVGTNKLTIKSEEQGERLPVERILSNGQTQSRAGLKDVIHTLLLEADFYSLIYLVLKDARYEHTIDTPSSTT